MLRIVGVAGHRFIFKNLYYENIKFFQDEFGNTQYGYSNLNSAKHEVGNGFTGVSGSYQYVDANGKLQTVNYVADALGFRVEDTRLPVAPVYDGVAPEAPVYDGVAPEAPVYDGVAPEPVQDTPEVVAAREAHLAAFEEVASRYVLIILLIKRKNRIFLEFSYHSLKIGPTFEINIHCL